MGIIRLSEDREAAMGKYILQERKNFGLDYGPWMDSGFGPFETLDEAKACLAQRAFPNFYRIAEAYTVTRYKAVKL